jgi:hypothetical protein
MPQRLSCADRYGKGRPNSSNLEHAVKSCTTQLAEQVLPEAAIVIDFTKKPCGGRVFLINWQVVDFRGVGRKMIYGLTPITQGA